MDNSTTANDGIDYEPSDGAIVHQYAYQPNPKPAPALPLTLTLRLRRSDHLHDAVHHRRDDRHGYVALALALTLTLTLTR